MTSGSGQVLIYLEKRISNLSKNQLEKIISLSSQTIKQKYSKNRKCKRGKLSPYITSNKWEQILRAENNPKFRFCYYLMRKLALRVGEIVELNIKNIRLDLKEIFMITEKSKMPDICYLDNEAARKIYEWVQENRTQIDKHQGYIFFPDPKSHSKRKFVSCDTVRNHFRAAVAEAHLQTCYGKAYNQNRVLNLFTTHSCRHSGITDFYLKTKDLVLTQIYARHQSIKSTMVYIHHTEKDIREALENPLIKFSQEDRAILLMMVEEFRRNKNCLA